MARKALDNQTRGAEIKGRRRRNKSPLGMLHAFYLLLLLLSQCKLVRFLKLVFSSFTQNQAFAFLFLRFIRSALRILFPSASRPHFFLNFSIFQFFVDAFSSIHIKPKPDQSVHSTGTMLSRCPLVRSSMRTIFTPLAL